MAIIVSTCDELHLSVKLSIYGCDLQCIKDRQYQMVKPLRFMTGLVARSSVAHNNQFTNAGDKIQGLQANKWMCTNPNSNDTVTVRYRAKSPHCQSSS